MDGNDDKESAEIEMKTNKTNGKTMAKTQKEYVHIHIHLLNGKMLEKRKEKIMKENSVRRDVHIPTHL